MNNDLISREALKKACSEMVKGSNNSDFIPCPSWNNAMELIDNAPTVTPTLQLKDITDEDVARFAMIWQRATNYCPNCGAKMDKTVPQNVIEVGSHDGEWILHKDRL